jgi:hypothetical protein
MGLRVPHSRIPPAYFVIISDRQIRQIIHHKLLRRYRGSPDTLVVEELGLKHGSCRADIAVVNGRLIGYEIKSDRDTLARLKRQIAGYDAVFDAVTVVVGPRHGSVIRRRVPSHWGIVVVSPGRCGSIKFTTKRKARSNPRIDLLSVTQLLWKREALGIISNRNPAFDGTRLARQKLYEYLADNLNSAALRRAVRSCLRHRSNWRCQRRLSQGGDSCRHDATSSGSPAELDGGHTVGCIHLHPRTSYREKTPI